MNKDRGPSVQADSGPRTRRDQLGAWLWVLATAGGWTLGTVPVLIIGRAVSPLAGWRAAWVAGTAAWPGGAVLLWAAGGVIAGLGQWLLLRRWFRGAAWWVLVVAVGLAAASLGFLRLYRYGKSPEAMRWHARASGLVLSGPEVHYEVVFLDEEQCRDVPALWYAPVGILGQGTAPGLLFGILFGGAQWLLIGYWMGWSRSWARWAIPWIGAMMAAWAIIGITLWSAFGPKAAVFYAEEFAQAPWLEVCLTTLGPYSDQTVLAVGPLSGVVVGILTLVGLFVPQQA